MRESIFFASLRSFFMTLFGVAGFLMGILVVIIFIGVLSTSVEGEPEISYSYAPQILANADGVRKSLSSDAPVILRLNIDGFIGLESLNQKTIEQQLIESRERSLKNDRVKAILLYINSPGGSATDADAIYRAIKTYKERYKTPIYAYVDGLCASGGMYVAAAADKIYASDVSMIGSVGVILSPALNISQLMEKIGVQSLTLYEGKGKDNLNPLRPWKEGEADNIKTIIDDFYNIFVDVVSSNRPKLDKTKLVDVYGANVFPSSLAKEYGFIDEKGTSYNETLKHLAQAIGIEDNYYQVMELKSTNWLSEIFRSDSGIHNLLQGRITHQIQLSPELDPKLQNQILYLYR